MVEGYIHVLNLIMLLERLKLAPSLDVSVSRFEQFSMGNIVAGGVTLPTFKIEFTV